MVLPGLSVAGGSVYADFQQCMAGHKDRHASQAIAFYDVGQMAGSGEPGCGDHAVLENIG